ncbi:hypothetical protein N665_0019s0025 [Sinapis alba]|nr:hypothetical protein N665_0019s0025 [Sinapis alba]
MSYGIGSVMVPEEITKDVEPLWEDFLIGKFLDNAPHIAKVFEVNSTMMKFRIMNQADKNRIMRRGMWNIAGVPVVVTKWSPVVEKEKPPTQSIPMWVHIKNVPLKMFSWQGLSFVTSPLGVPVRLHPETTQCLNLSVAKIFVKVDLSKDLPKKLHFNIQGEEVLVEYSYPWLPTKCVKCDKWGHSVKACLLEKEGKKEEHEILEEGEIKDTVVEKEKEGPIDGEKSREEKEEEEKEWATVSPGKASRSPSSKQRELEFGQVSILTKSRFSVEWRRESGTRGSGELNGENEGEGGYRFWSETVPLYNSTSALFRLSKKLKALKQSLRHLSKDKVGDISKKTSEAYKFLCEAQTKTLEDPNPTNMEVEYAAYERWSWLSRLEERVISQRAKIFWLEVGDGNNKSFHRAAKVREVRNSIREIKRLDGSVADNQEDIKKEAVDLFYNFLAHVWMVTQANFSKPLGQLLGGTLLLPYNPSLIKDFFQRA